MKCSIGDAVQAIRKAYGNGLSFAASGAYRNKIVPASSSKPAGFKTYEEAIARAIQFLGNGYRLVGSWWYTDNFVQNRFQSGGTKTYRPIHRDADGLWRFGCPPRPWPLYRVREVKDWTQWVFVCEGEKACDAAWRIGLQAVSSFGGAQSPERSDWRPLAGARVCILPDNDEPGRQFATRVRAILRDLKPQPVVRVVNLGGNEGDDIYDFVERVDDAEESRRLILWKLHGGGQQCGKTVKFV